MAVRTVDNDIYLAGYNLTTTSNSATVSQGHESLDPTTFGATTRLTKAGLKTSQIDLEGFSDYGETPSRVDEILANEISDGTLLSVWAVDASVGNTGEALEVSKVSHARAFNIGELQSFSASFSANGPVMRPTSLGAITAGSSGDGTAVQVGAVSATQRIHGILHVTAASGTSPTLDCTIESDNAGGFPSPVTRMTFAQQTAAGANGFDVPTPVDGAFTDDWWRVSYTIGGGSPNFTFVVALYIGPAV